MGVKLSEHKQRRIDACMNVFDFIVEYKSEHDGNSPTIREIMAACGISSTSVVDFYLKHLESMGMIEVGSFQYRGIRVIGGEWTYNGGGHDA